MGTIAHQSRINQTEAEKRLWYRFRNQQIAGAKFRWQAPIGRYIVDFACFERQMVIELDGGQHAPQDLYDDRRGDWLDAEGFLVLRFWNNVVLENTEGVLLRIEETLGRRAPVARSPHPGPLPQGEREL
jgi:very-short-patch-repair endonuclease